MAINTLGILLAGLPIFLLPKELPSQPIELPYCMIPCYEHEFIEEVPAEEIVSYGYEELEGEETIYLDVPFSQEVQDFAFSRCEEYNIDPKILFSVCWRESSFNPNAIGDNGEAIGLTQIQPKWFAAEMEMLGITDLTVPEQNIELCLYILNDLHSKYDMWSTLQYYRYGDPFNSGEYANEVLGYAATINTK